MDNMMHTACLRCGKHAVSVPFGLDGLPYTNYSYCEDCLREGLKLLNELVRCGDCRFGGSCSIREYAITKQDDDWFCRDGKRRIS